MTENERRARARADARLASALPLLARVRAERARLDAEETRLLADARDIADEWAAAEGARAGDIPHRTVASEIAALWRVSDRTVQRQLDECATLVDSYGETFDALRAGRISLAHARTIVAAGAIVERAELRAEYEAAVLDYAERESASRLAPLAKRRAEWFAESTFAERHERAQTTRRVWLTDLDDGMAELGAILPAVLARGAYDRLSQLARAEANAPVSDQPDDDSASAETGDDRSPAPRTMDAIRADVFADLLLASDPVAHNTGASGVGAIHARVSVTVPVLSLLGEHVADPFEAISLDGRCPVDLDTARSLAAAAPGWDRILTHPVTGAVLDVDRYRPSEEQRRHLRVRDEHCRFPGCRVAVARCDADHTRDFALGGRTAASNLAHLCRRHHTLKHASSWSVRQRAGGELIWTSPTGRVYPDTPVSAVAFSPDVECDPVAAPF